MAGPASALSSLADPTRRALIDALRSGPLSVNELTRHAPVSQSAVSQHLQVLKAADLVEERRAGTRRIYSLRPEALGELRKYVEQLWVDSLTSFSKASDA